MKSIKSQNYNAMPAMSLLVESQKKKEKKNKKNGLYTEHPSFH
jgi:hypothetical protein